MADKIKLVSGDTGPQIRITLTDESTGVPLDLTGGAATLHFRKVGTTNVLFSRGLYVPTDSAANGVAIILWQEGDLALPAGDYEGEVEIVLASGQRQTLFDFLKFKLRAEMA